MMEVFAPYKSELDDFKTVKNTVCIICILFEFLLVLSKSHQILSPCNTSSSLFLEDER